MKHKLEDGRLLMAAYDDIKEFFTENKVVGRTISDIRAASFDYMIRNLNELDDIYSQRAECAIETGDRICVLFDDGDSMEIEFCGDGPVILGFNTADFSKYPEADGTCYTLHTMFQFCLGHRIVNVHFDRTDKKMSFPEYCGINMSGDDDGIKEIRFLLNGGTTMRASGLIDYFQLEHAMDFGDFGKVRIPYRELLAELNEETLQSIFGNQTFKHAADTGEDLVAFSSTEVDTSEIDEVFGTFGFKDKVGNVVIEPQYLSCGEFHCGLCPVAIGRTFYRTSDGEKYYEMHWGYINTHGEVVIPFKFNEAWSFNKYGVATVTEKYGENSYLIDTDGNQLPNSNYIYVDRYYDYEDRYFEFSDVDTEIENNVGLYDTKEKKILFPPMSQDIYHDDEDFFLIEETGELGHADIRQHYVNSKGEEVYPGLANKGFGFVELPNENGHAVVCVFSWEELTDNQTGWTPMNGKMFKRHNRWGVADLRGKLVIPAEYDSICDMKDGTFECRKDDKTIVVRTEV